jgi:hypothetical protein
MLWALCFFALCFALTSGDRIVALVALSIAGALVLGYLSSLMGPFAL